MMEVLGVVSFLLMVTLGWAMALDMIGEDSRKQIAKALYVKFERLFFKKKNKED